MITVKHDQIIITESAIETDSGVAPLSYDLTGSEEWSSCLHVPMILYCHRHSGPTTGDMPKTQKV